MNYTTLERNFTAHGFLPHYFETAAEACEYLCEQIQDTTVGIGGCMTAKEMGLDQKLAEKNTVFWHWLVPGRETLLEVQKAPVYICSANGVSETGEIVNIDGTGNRVGMTVFGPQKVYMVIGKNKICPDLASAYHRARNVASPKNAKRFNLDTPCAKNADRCYNCNHPQRICKAFVILERPVNGMEIELLFINEDLGY